MEMTKCPKCGLPFRYGTEQVGVDNNNIPIYHRFGYCDTCMSKYDINILSNKNYAKEEVVVKKKKVRFGWLAFLIILMVFYAIGSNDESEDTSESSSSNRTSVASERATMEPKVTESPIEEIQYIVCTVDEMVELLETNAMKAEKKYSDQYIEVTGILDVIDSDGRYISLSCINDKWNFTDVQCYMVNQEQKDIVIEMKKDDQITVRIKCTEVGEVMGFSGDIIEFVK